MEKVRLAVIGLNFGKAHAGNIKEGKVPGQLAALADLNPDYKELADSYEVPFYTDYKEMLAQIKPEGVIIAVPPKFTNKLLLIVWRLDLMYLWKNLLHSLQKKRMN